MSHSAPHIETPKGTVAAIKKALGKEALGADGAVIFTLGVSF